MKGIPTREEYVAVMYFVYILISEADGTLYTGQTINLVERLKRHNNGLIKTTKSHRPYRLGYYEIWNSRSEAMNREWQFKKQWNTERKKKLIAGFDPTKSQCLLTPSRSSCEEHT